MDLEAALTYPTNDDDWLKTVGIGGGLLLVPGALALIVGVLTLITFGLAGFLFLFVVPVQLVASAFVFGYYVDVIRETIRGNDLPPAFDDWGRLGKDGAFALIIGLIYQLPLIVIGGAAVAVMFFFLGIGSAVGSQDAAAGLSLVGLVAFFAVGALTLVYSLVAGYFLPISLCAYAQEGTLGAAFSTERLKTAGFDSDYAIAWVVALAGVLVLNQVVGVLNLMLVGFFVQFYVFVVVARVVAEGYADSLDIEAVRERPSAEASDWTDDGTAHGQP